MVNAQPNNLRTKGIQETNNSRTKANSGNYMKFMQFMQHCTIIQDKMQRGILLRFQSHDLTLQRLLHSITDCRLAILNTFILRRTKDNLVPCFEEGDLICLLTISCFSDNPWDHLLCYTCFFLSPHSTLA